MTDDIGRWASLLWGTVLLRPYVFAFLAAFFAASTRDLGWRGSLGFFLWGWCVAFASEYASTRIGIPFGLYHYTGTTAGRELYLSNVPFFDSISFVFLAYAALCLSRRALPSRSGAIVAAVAGVYMMLLDVVIDPLAVRGARWFLGHVFYYPAGGIYFGVPLSNFAGWAIVGWIIAGGYVWATGTLRAGRGSSPALGVALYCGVLLFNLALTIWIGEWGLSAAGLLVHTAGFLLLYGLSAVSSPPTLRAPAVADRGVRGASSR